MRLDYQAELLLSFQEERRQQFRAQEAAQAVLTQNPGLRARLMRSSGALLIVIGSRLQGWSGSEVVGPTAEASREVAWQ